MLRVIFLSLVLMVAPRPVSSGEFERGEVAFAQGDYKTALRVWKSLAANGSASAQYNLGLMFENGLGAAVDPREAIKWYIRAAKQGHGKAQNNLGAMYATGLGMRQDPLRAHMWWKIAVLGGVKIAAENLRKIATKMSPAQIAMAEEMAFQCIVIKKLAGC